MNKEKMKLAREATEMLYAMGCEYRSLYQQERQARMSLEEQIQNLEAEKKQQKEDFDKNFEEIKDALYGLLDGKGKPPKKFLEKLDKIEKQLNKDDKKSKEDHKSNKKDIDKKKPEKPEEEKENENNQDAVNPEEELNGSNQNNPDENVAQVGSETGFSTSEGTATDDENDSSENDDLGDAMNPDRQ